MTRPARDWRDEALAHPAPVSLVPDPPATRAMRCDRCGTIDAYAVPEDERTPRLSFPICDRCPEPCIDLRPLDYEPDIHVDCDGTGCPVCRWTGLEQTGPTCAECDAPGRYRPRDAATLCDAHASRDHDVPPLDMRARLLAQGL